MDRLSFSIFSGRPGGGEERFKPSSAASQQLEAKNEKYLLDIHFFSWRVACKTFCEGALAKSIILLYLEKQVLSEAKALSVN